MASKTARPRIEQEHPNLKNSLQPDDGTPSVVSQSAQKLSLTIDRPEFGSKQVTEGSGTRAHEPEGTMEAFLSAQANNGANRERGFAAPSFDLPPKTSKSSNKRGRYTSNAW